jgi:alcohol dehydrogenase (cytochrome c)
MQIQRSLSRAATLAVAFVAGPSVATQQQGGSPTSAGVTYERLRNSEAEPRNWMHYWGNYRAAHYSGLTEITTRNVSRLQVEWSLPLPGTSRLETQPIVIDGIMYTSGQPGTVLAIEARTGRRIWQFDRQRKARNPNEINPYNRGVAVLGNRVFVGTLDAAIVAIDARTGVLLWETQIADSMVGYSVTSAPLVVKDKVIVGVSGGEFGAPGFLDAYDATTGRRVWRWNAIPGPGEFGNDTWAGESWKTGGGPTWLTGSYDPDLDTLYWTVGNPGAQIDRSVRGDGDNLFTDSVVALDPATGRRKWHYQFTPNDGHDWDATEAVVLVDRRWHGQDRKLLFHADRNGMFYVLDRTDGKFLAATPFVYQNWNMGFTANGRPIQIPGSNSSAEGSFLVYPSVGGGTNFQAPSYSPLTTWFYLAYSENAAQYVSAPSPFEAGRQYLGRGRGSAPERQGDEPLPSAGIKALDPETGQMMWDFKLSQSSLQNGVMATAGGVVFAASREGKFIALDGRTGFLLWNYPSGSSMAASPMSFAVDGRQYVAVASANAIHCFALPQQAQAQ